MNTTLSPEQQAKLTGLRLLSGGHENGRPPTNNGSDAQLCAMEAVAWLAGEPHSDSPKCACPVLRKFVIECNDRWTNADRQKLLDLVPELIGTRSTRAVEIKRAYFFADFACRTVLPWLCDKLKKPELAVRMRGLKAVTDRATAELARQEARSVRDILRSAAYAAYAAAAYAADAAAYAYAAAAAAYAYAAADAADAAAYAYAAAAYAAAYAYAARSEMADLCIKALREAINIKE